jgi:CheY-like chemotaxis protein/signal transduction histidine kinase
MRLNHLNRIVIRCVIAVLWLLEFVAVTAAQMVPLLYLLPVLALFSFFLVDYFSGFVIAILLTTVVKIIDLDQVSGITRALIIDAVWISAILAAAIRLITRFDTRVVTKPALAQSSRNHLTQETSATGNDQTDEFPVKFWHDLQTPISMILGFCNAILRTHHHREAIPPLYRDNIEAISRNAQQLEKMIGDLLNGQKSVRIPDAEELEPSALIQETTALLHDLMMAHQITLEIRIDDPLPRLVLHRIIIRQVLLNLLRTIAIVHVNGLPGMVTVRAKLQNSELHITVTALNMSIHRAVADENWSLNERLLEKVGARLWVEAIGDSGLDAYSSVVLALPIPTGLRAVRPVLPDSIRAVGSHPVVVISEESNVIDLFREQLSQYEVVGIKDLNTLRLTVAQIQPVAVIFTREQSTAHLQTISELVGADTPIIICPVATAEERLRRLNAVYLSKPVEYDTLFSILTAARPPTEPILIVDDNADSAEMVAQMLLAMSPTFVSKKACLAKEALIVLDQYPIGAIILDVRLPDMDGITLVQEIRAHGRFAHLPIVLVSAHQTLDFMTPVIASDRILLFQFGEFEADRVATYVEALINVTVSTALPNGQKKKKSPDI